MCEMFRDCGDDRVPTLGTCSRRLVRNQCGPVRIVTSVVAEPPQELVHQSPSHVVCPYRALWSQHILKELEDALAQRVSHEAAPAATGSPTSPAPVSHPARVAPALRACMPELTVHSRQGPHARSAIRPVVWLVATPLEVQP
jgi:hypothetical protein